MTDLSQTTPATRFDSFNVHKTFYKQIGDHKIDVGVLVPKDLKPGKHPILVKFHGGGLVLGDALYPDWFASFLIPFIHRTSSIVVLPNYRLIPEHNGIDINDDLADFWKWYDGNLASYVASIDPSLELDFERLLVSGESAGGYMGLQSALTLPQGKARAVLVQYPMTDALRRDPGDPGTNVSGVPIPPPEHIDEHLSAVEPGTVVSSGIPPARFQLAIALGHYNRWVEFFGTEKRLLPITAIEDAKHFPPTLIIHGEQDTAVKISDTRAFIAKVGEVLGEKVQGDVRLAAAEGEHGFDTEFKEDEVPWLKEGLKWIEGLWLA